MNFVLGPIIAFFGRLALKYGLVWVETRFPGSKAFIDEILQWLENQAASGNTNAVSQIQSHCSKLTCYNPDGTEKVLGKDSDSALIP